MHIKVGDQIVVERSRYRPSDAIRIKHGTVIKVARKYFTVEFVEVVTNFQGEDTYTRRSTDEFEIATGIQRGDPNYTQYRDHAYTPADYQVMLYERDLLLKLREDHRVYGGNSDSTMILNRWSTGHLVELLDLLDRVKADQRIKELDR